MLKKLTDICVLVFNIFLAIIRAIIKIVWSPTEKSIHGEVALVTGAGHGMGRLLAVKLARLGAKVIVVDINRSTNFETAEIIEGSGGTAYSYTCDLSKADEIKNLAKTIKEEVGEVTMLINNAGVVFNTDFLSLTDEMVTTTFNVNVISHFRLIREFLPDMKRKNHGHIIAMASISSGTAAPGFIDYSSSKHAVAGLMDGLRRELRWEGKNGIKTTYACPPFVTTGFVKNPQTNSSLMCPVLPPEKVVDEIMHAVLIEQPRVDIPPIGPAMLLKAILPDEVIELVFDFIKPTCKILFPKMSENKKL
ncbi:estradiol 17-beta-dehydrogenase 11-like [Clavelina lepadiformis]|uniref:Uncharacterized protein n=1 Tax=Clavelina lepadiformis TaxID=159417 RepID=A0ABP0FQY3_CLALP